MRDTYVNGLTPKIFNENPLAPNPETLPSAWALKLNGNIIGGSASRGSETCFKMQYLSVHTRPIGSEE